MSKTEDILKQRQQEHGSFYNNAGCSQKIKDILKTEMNYEKMDVDQKEALDAICSKMSRIVVGDHNKEDHWRDIAGYATLVADRLDASTSRYEVSKEALKEEPIKVSEETKEEMIKQPNPLSTKADMNVAEYVVKKIGEGDRVFKKKDLLCLRDSGLLHNFEENVGKQAVEYMNYPGIPPHGYIVIDCDEEEKRSGAV